MRGLTEFFTHNFGGISRLAEFALIAVIFFGLGALYAERVGEGGPIAVTEPEKGYMLASPVPVSELVSPVAETSNIPVPSLKGEPPHQLFGGGGEYVASRQGRAYYHISCSNTIKEENKIYFKTKEDAQKAGLTPAKTCFK